MDYIVKGTMSIRQTDRCKCGGELWIDYSVVKNMEYIEIRCTCKKCYEPVIIKRDFRDRHAREERRLG